MSPAGTAAALAALARAWKWPLTAEGLVRVVISAYLAAAKSEGGEP